MAFTYDYLSPIHWISSVRNPSESEKVFVRSPSSYQYDLEDVSESDAGRTEDGMMHKKRIGQVSKLEMTWNNVDTPTVSTLLKMFQPEYLYCEYLDAMEGGYKVDLFYVGNRSTPLYTNSNGIGLWQNVAFNLIRRDGGTML